jgi:hypothetical protein
VNSKETFIGRCDRFLENNLVVLEVFKRLQVFVDKVDVGLTSADGKLKKCDCHQQQHQV